MSIFTQPLTMIEKLNDITQISLLSERRPRFMKKLTVSHHWGDQMWSSGFWGFPAQTFTSI
jgi:hypothetical protein